MKKLLMLFALLTLTSGLAMADPAIVINRGTGNCGMVGADADGNAILGGIGSAVRILENGNKVDLQCKGRDITNESGRAQSFSGFSCAIASFNSGLVITMDTHAAVAPNGQATLSCKFSK